MKLTEQKYMGFCDLLIDPPFKWRTCESVGISIDQHSKARIRDLDYVGSNYLICNSMI